MQVMAKRKRSRSLMVRTKRSRFTPKLAEFVVAKAPASTPQLEEVVVAEAQLGLITTDKSSPNIEDTISEDGILCYILSFLPLREAVGTSVLSHRWRDLCTNLPILKFNAANMFDADSSRLVHRDSNTITNKEKFDLIEEKRDQFIRSVNSVLQQRRGNARLDEFWIRYFVPKVHSHHLDAWVRFAVTAKTKQLNVQLHKPFFKEIENDPYDFPCHLLGSSSSIERLFLLCCSLKPPSNFHGLTCLKDLNLTYVDLIDEDINRVLSNCYSLESLSIWKSPRLLSLSIPHPLRQFQYLMVKECEQLREIKMDAIRFSRLLYWGPPVDFIFRQSSQLKHAKVFLCIEPSPHNLHFYLNKLSRQLPHLESLTFLIDGVSKVADLPKGFNNFIHLRHLEWVWEVKMTSLHFLGNFLDAAPFLEELVLRFTVRVVEPPPPELCELRKMLPKHHRTQLKTIEFSGFYFDHWQVEIALYLLNSSCELEMMKIKKGRNILAEIKETDINNLRQEVPASVKLSVV